MNKSVLLILAGLLVCFGLFKPNLNNIIDYHCCKDRIEEVTVNPPTNRILKNQANSVIQALFSNSDRKLDGMRLASLYADIATLIELDGDDQVVKTTDDVRQANSLSGLMLKLNIKGKYPNLPSATNKVIVEAIGTDNIMLNKDLRAKAADGFKALAWACKEGSK